VRTITRGQGQGKHKQKQKECRGAGIKQELTRYTHISEDLSLHLNLLWYHSEIFFYRLWDSIQWFQACNMIFLQECEGPLCGTPFQSRHGFLASDVGADGKDGGV
jgi:hypothetical protein